MFLSAIEIINVQGQASAVMMDVDFNVLLFTMQIVGLATSRLERLLDNCFCVVCRPLFISGVFESPSVQHF